MYQYAAGCFDHIQTTLITQLSEKAPIGLDLNTLGLLRDLMLAQAQESYWQKAVSDKLKDSIIARLSIQASEFYSSALEKANKSSVTRSDWIHHISCKKYHFEAAAHFRMSRVAIGTHKYGEEVARLKKSTIACEKALQNSSTIGPLVLEDIQSLHKILKENLKRAEKDNDLIYLKPVPNLSDLPPINPAPMVKALIGEEISSPKKALAEFTYGNQLFDDLLPFFVIRAVQVFKEKQESYIEQHVVRPIHSLKRSTNNLLQTLELPGSIEAIKKPKGLPQTLLTHSEEIKSRGGIKKLTEALNDIQKLYLQSRHLLDGAKERLEIESKEDDMMRERQGSSRWTRDNSIDAAAELWDRIDKFEGYLEVAQNGDSTIKQQFFGIESHIRLLCDTKKNLEQYVPNSSSVQINGETAEIIAKIQNALSEFRRLTQQRSQFLEATQIKSKNFDILPKLVSEYKSLCLQDPFKSIDISEFSPIYDSHITNFDSDIEYVSSQRKIQKQFDTNLKELYERFVQLTKPESGNSKRQEALQSLEVAYYGFNELIENIQQGLKFYEDFVKSVNIILKDCDDFVYERRVEGRELENDIMNGVSRELPQAQARSSSPIENDHISVPPSPNLNARFSSEQTLWTPESGIRFG